MGSTTSKRSSNHDISIGGDDNGDVNGLHAEPSIAALPPRNLGVCSAEDDAPARLRKTTLKVVALTNSVHWVAEEQLTNAGIDG